MSRAALVAARFLTWFGVGMLLGMLVFLLGAD